MAWLTPKTNWSSADGVGYGDLNRIEGNTDDLNTRLNEVLGIATGNLEALPTFSDYDEVKTPGAYHGAYSGPRTNEPYTSSGSRRVTLYVENRGSGNIMQTLRYDDGIGKGRMYQRFFGSSTTNAPWTELHSSAGLPDPARLGQANTFTQDQTFQGNATLDNSELRMKYGTYERRVMHAFGADNNGMGVAFGAGGRTIIYAGEAADVMIPEVTHSAEDATVIADSNVFLIAGLQSGWANRKELRAGGDGTLRWMGNNVWHAGNLPDPARLGQQNQFTASFGIVASDDHGISLGPTWRTGSAIGLFPGWDNKLYINSYSLSGAKARANAGGVEIAGPLYCRNVNGNIVNEVWDRGHLRWNSGRLEYNDGGTWKAVGGVYRTFRTAFTLNGSQTSFANALNISGSPGVITAIRTLEGNTSPIEFRLTLDGSVVTQKTFTSGISGSGTYYDPSGEIFISDTPTPIYFKTSAQVSLRFPNPSGNQFRLAIVYAI